jgi:hypothetical protein
MSNGHFDKIYELRPLNFSLFQNSHVINTVGYEECLSENSTFSKVSKREERHRNTKARYGHHPRTLENRGETVKGDAR